MQQGLANGILLLLVVLFFVGRFVWGNFLKPKETAGPKESAGKEELGNVAALYKKKTRFRLGVLAFSLCALVAMYVSDSRLVPFVFIFLAGCCQVGAMRQNTRKAFAESMEQKMGTPL